MRAIRTIGEFGLIARIAKGLHRDASVRIGVGDDAAVVNPHTKIFGVGVKGSGGSLLLIASDMFIEGVHFVRRQLPWQWIGWKALAANISDIAAMGGLPRWAVVSLGLPPMTPIRFVDSIYSGLERCARRFRMCIVGGDTVRSPKVVVDVAIVGTVDRKCLT